jgi:hypothetical protein
MNPFSLIFGGVVGAVKALGSQYMEGKQKKHEAKMAHLGRIAQGEANYNELAQQGMAASVKDEILTIWMITMMSLNFYPPAQPYMEEGWKFLQASAPDWFAYCFVGMFVAVFGLKGWKIFKS